MRKLLLATAFSLAAMASANAAFVADLGIDPTSQTGNFSAGAAQGVSSGPFAADFTFQLVGGPQFVTIASVTNVFPNSTDFITNFSASVFMGIPGVDTPTLEFGPGTPVSCPIVPSCQVIGGSGILNPGNYFLEVSGIGGGTSGFGGNVSTQAVPGPVVGAGLPGLLGLLGFGGWQWKRRKRKPATA